MKAPSAAGARLAAFKGPVTGAESLVRRVNYSIIQLGASPGEKKFSI